MKSILKRIRLIRRRSCLLDNKSKELASRELILRNISAPIDSYAEYACAKAEEKMRKAGLSIIGAPALFRYSIDARRKGDTVVRYACSVLVHTEHIPPPGVLASLDAVVKEESRYQPVPGDERMEHPPVVVGFGPCGMFAALALAEAGYRPVVFERGGDIQSRDRSVRAFYKTGVLDEQTNIQFGAGGAGTYSDGKLMTRKNDARCEYVLNVLNSFGAPDDILVNARPHIGTDNLKTVVKGIAARIEKLGGRIFYRTRVTGFGAEGSSEVTVLTDRGNFSSPAVLLAVGHSARDTYSALLEGGFDIVPKAFSVGVRIEHLREDINRALYGSFADRLPPAEYNLSFRKGERGVYSFCMCPGGHVVAAASEEGGVVTNGMSYCARDAVNSNSALAVSVFPEDLSSGPLAGVEFQRKLERLAFSAALEAGASPYSAPVSTVGDFMNPGRLSHPDRVQPSYMGGERFALCDLSRILPGFVTDMLRAGICEFGKKIRGFDSPSALLTGVETRTSAPLRIKREDSGTAPGFPHVYPCGEGAGYAGGITSAAIDGLNAAEKVINRYRPFSD